MRRPVCRVADHHRRAGKAGTAAGRIWQALHDGAATGNHGQPCTGAIADSDQLFGRTPRRLRPWEQYAEMWEQDATAMYDYAASAAARTRHHLPPAARRNKAGLPAQAEVSRATANAGAPTALAGKPPGRNRNTLLPISARLFLRRA